MGKTDKSMRSGLHDKNLTKVSYRNRSISRSCSTNRSNSSINYNKHTNNESIRIESAHKSRANPLAATSTQASSPSSLKNHQSTNKSQSQQFYQNYVCDETNSETDENESIRNKKFTNNRKSHVPVRHLFNIVLKQKKQIGICNLCLQDCSMSAGSDGNLRTHLAYKHNMPEVLTPSQFEKYSKKDGKVEVKISKEEQMQIHEMIVNSIITDSRTFNDFKKKGIFQLLKYLKPGYKTPSKKTIRKMIKTKYNIFCNNCSTEILLFFFRYQIFKEKMKEILEKLDYLSLTTDLWKNKTNDYFLGLTIHFFDKELNYKSFLFGFRKFSLLHYAENIREFIKKELGHELLQKVFKTFHVFNYIFLINQLISLDCCHYFRQ
jgi:hypothetical protein